MKILAFGIAKEILGSGAIDAVITSGTTAGMLKERLQEQYPELQRLSAFMIAVNGEYAAANAVISEADEVAIIPPVSGG